MDIKELIERFQHMPSECFMWYLKGLSDGLSPNEYLKWYFKGISDIQECKDKINERED